jgi:tryptophan halogenase
MKICIVGGGSSGWMTASTLVKAFPDWDITLIESPKVASVGVGESTTQLFRQWTHFLDLKDEDWMPACDATYKISVRFHNFNKIGDRPWQYPFGSPRTDIDIPPDVWWYAQSQRGWTNDQFARDFYVSAYCAEKNLLPVDHEYFNLHRQTGFHFDAVKFANWLKENYAIPRGVRYEQEHVTRDILNEDYDLFFDCTGFKSLLNDSEWIDYSDYLPNNRAWVTRLPYINKEQEMKPVTDCTALSSGWVWNVPTWERIGTGYNFCDKYISTDDALQEFATHLKVDHEEHGFRLIEYKTGRKKEIWNGKVVSIGLSAGFIEPLESNGLLSTHTFLTQFCRVMAGKDHVTQFMRDTFNNNSNYNFDGFASFVALHYAMTQRNDSPYWRAVSNIRYPYNNLFKSAQINYMEQSIHFPIKITWESDSLLCVMAGHGWNPFNDVILDEMEFFGGVPKHARANTFEIPPYNGIDTMTTPLNYYLRTLYAS